MAQLIRYHEEFIKVLPAWAKDLSYKYLSKTNNLYIIHGNIRDFLPHRLVEGEFIFTRIQEYISEVLFGNRDIIIYFDRSSGVNFNEDSMREEYLKTLKEAYPNVDPTVFFSPDPLEAFHYLEKFFLITLAKRQRVVLIVDYAETITPAAELAQMTEEDRTVLVTMNRWSHDPIFTQADISIILLTENLSDLSPRLVASPSTVKVHIPIPDEEVRLLFLQFLLAQEKLTLDPRLNLQTMARITSGLNLMNLNQITAERAQEDLAISLEYLKEKKKHIVETEASGLIEFLESPYDLSMVSGHDFVKRRFKSAAKAIKQGRLDVLPMGYLISGAVGTGKSFLVQAFAGEIGIPIIKFHNLPTRWQGVTEGSLEKVLNILKAMAPVGVMIDEADAFLGSRDSQRTGTASSQAFAQMTAFMGDTSFRGRILWFLVSNRPDRIPLDLKRQGRAEEHLALFCPESQEEKEDLFRTLVKKLDLKIREFPLGDILKKMKQDFSGADLEAILIRAKFLAAMENHSFITKEHLEDTIRDFIPPAYPHEIDLQNLAALLECTSREMVPKRYQNYDRTRLIQEIGELKTLLGEKS